MERFLEKNSNLEIFKSRNNIREARMMNCYEILFPIHYNQYVFWVFKHIFSPRNVKFCTCFVDYYIRKSLRDIRIFIIKDDKDNILRFS